MSIRMQIYLTEELYDQLKQKSKQSGRPMAEHVRESLDKYLAEPEIASIAEEDPIWNITGRVKSAEGDLSTKHDQYLYGRKHGDKQ